MCTHSEHHLFSWQIPQSFRNACTPSAASVEWSRLWFGTPVSCPPTSRGCWPDSLLAGGAALSAAHSQLHARAASEGKMPGRLCQHPGFGTLSGDCGYGRTRCQQSQTSSLMAAAALFWRHCGNTNKWTCLRPTKTELKSCVKVEVAVLGSLVLIICAVSVDTKQCWKTNTVAKWHDYNKAPLP